MLADKWRHERNFWMAALAVTLWVILNRFYSLNQKNLNLCAFALPLLIKICSYKMKCSLTFPVHTLQEVETLC
jgi:hypothetical protein